jgi:hypothetical protein
VWAGSLCAVRYVPESTTQLPQIAARLSRARGGTGRFIALLAPHGTEARGARSESMIESSIALLGTNVYICVHYEVLQY